MSLQGPHLGNSPSVALKPIQTTPPNDHVLEIPATLISSQLSIYTSALIDSGATSCFMDIKFATQNNIPVRCKRIPQRVEAIDGKELSSGAITHETPLIKLCIGQHQEDLSFNLIASPHHPIVLGVPWLKTHNPNIQWAQHKITFLPKSCHKHGVLKPLIISSLSASSISTTLTESEPLSNSPSEDFTKLPAYYHDLVEVFSKKKADKLPVHRMYDHAIDLEPGTTPPYGPIYNLSEPELKALRENLDENLAKGFIRHSQSPAAAPILFVKKKDGSLRLCVDYRGLNKITKKNRYPLPLIPSLLDRLRSAKIYSKIDLRGAYNLVRIKEGDEWKTAFRTRYGHFEYLVMPFGLTNAPATFQHFMNDIFQDLLDAFVIIYLDDILIFSNSSEEHIQHVHTVLQRLLQHNLYAKLEKCEFHTQKVEFLGYVISPSGVSMDPSKVKNIVEWPTPKSVHDIQVFLGFANFYRRFIPNYSQLTTPLTSLLKKDTPFIWSEKAQISFNKLKDMFSSAPILAHPNPAKQFIVEADASDFAIGAILSQYDASQMLHPIAYFSRKLHAPECNYEIYDKELLAIKEAFSEWRHYLEGAQHKVLVYTDHRNLQYFTVSRQLNQRQIRWSQFFSRFNFEIIWRPGSQSGKPDALSRRSDLSPGGESKASSLKQQHQETLIKPEQFKLMTTTIPQSPFLDDIKNYAKKDKRMINICRNLLNNPHRSSRLRHFQLQDDILLYKNLVYVPHHLPLQLQILKTYHDSPASGHFGQAKTLELIQRDFWWPNMRQFTNKYIASCDICARSKGIQHKPHGLLQPLPVPQQCWTSVSLDFIVELPKSNGFNCILVVVDRFSKMAHFIPCTTSISASETADLFYRHVFRLHGMPQDIISDRGPQFVSHFWKQFFKLLQVEIKLSSAFHPQTDGQTERVNQILEQYLRCFINYQQDNWYEFLPLAEFAYNNSMHSSTLQSPFYINYGFHPRFSPALVPVQVSQVPAAEDKIAQLTQIQDTLVQTLSHAQEKYKYHADKARMESPVYKPGDKVWLLRYHIQTSRPNKKLDFKRLGPFSVLKQINPVAYELQLPATMKIHPVFHISLLEPYKDINIPGRSTPPPPYIEIDGQEEFEVQSILDSRIHRNQLQYLVEWKGYGISDASWEPAKNLKHAPQVISSFHRKYPNKPRVRRLPGEEGNVTTLVVT